MAYLMYGGKRVMLLFNRNKVRTKTSLLSLTAPTISLDGDTLTMTATDNRTQEFVIFVDGVEMATVANKVQQPEENITDLTGYTLVWNDEPLWSEAGENDGYDWNINFSSGSNSFVKLREDLFKDRFVDYYRSDGSFVTAYDNDYWVESYKAIQITGGADATNAVLIKWLKENGTLTKTQDTYTVSGTWYFDEDLGTIQGTEFPDISVNFTSNGKQFIEIHCAVGMIGYRNSGSPIIPYAYNTKYGWIDEAYRTITFDGVQTVSKEFYAWLVANATKQHHPEEV